MNKKIELLEQLRTYMLSNDEEWILCKELAQRNNGWFIPEFIELAVNTICEHYLEPQKLKEYASKFTNTNELKVIGITMAGNLPMVGFHDFLSVFLSPHKQRVKFSSKDNTLLPHLFSKMHSWDSSIQDDFGSSEFIRDCDAYIATGSNQSALVFKQYFAKYPHIIRNNKTSVAILDGTETDQELEALSDDVYFYFGLGCRNVTKLYIPKGYNFEMLLNIFRKYDELKNHNKYRNNFDYNLALYILNNQYYMSNESLLMVENESIYSPISVLHYEFYESVHDVKTSLQVNENLQAIIGKNFIPFGSAQYPELTDFADGINTVDFLNSL